jgi:membrane protein required for colicin V production
MFIDLVFILLMALAIFKGYSRGFIVAIFSFFALMAGLAAALKLSAVVAQKLQEKMNLDSYFLPVFSFVLVFLAVVVAVRLGAALIKKVARLAFLGWVDSFAGIMLYAILYVFVYSVVLFYATKIQLISPTTQSSSVTYSFLAPMGPWVINGLAVMLPFLGNMFADLSGFFEGVSRGSSNIKP